MSQQIKAQANQPTENIIEFCPLCGLRYSSPLPTNEEIHCDPEVDGCDKAFKLKIVPVRRD